MHTDPTGPTYISTYLFTWASLMAQVVKNLPAIQETQKTWVQSLGQEDTLEKKMATHSSILVWKIQYSCLENPMDRGAWLATVHGVTKSDMKEQARTFYI